MNRLKKLFQPTKLAKKLIRRIMLAALAGLVAAFGIALAVFWPRLRNEAHRSAAAASRYIMLTINETFTNLAGYADYISTSAELDAAVTDYVQAPADEGYLQICRTLESLSAVSSNIRTVALEGPAGYFQVGGLLGEEDRSLMNSTWYSDILDGKQVHTWSSFYVSNADRPVNTLVRVVPCNFGGDRYALCIFYSADSLMSTIDSLARDAYTGYMLTDSHDGQTGVPFYEQGELGNARTVAADYTGPDLYSTRDALGHYFLITIPACDWVLVGFIDSAAFNAALTPFLWLLFLICLALGAMVLLILVPSVNRLLSPLGKLGETMRRVSHEGPDFYSPVQTDDEIGELSDGFNDMLDEVRINAERELEQEKKEQRLCYGLMMAQINSHFFYNTLSVINSLARQGRCEDVIRANSALTTIFQDCLRPGGVSAGDTVEQEERVVECYWVIEKLDPSNDAELEWDIPPELEGARIPKNIIQPLVENALFHGLDDPRTGRKSGRVLVGLRREDGELVLRVRNDGAPIPAEQLAALNAPDDGREPSGQHIGLLNIRRRLRLLYGGRASMAIVSAEVTEVVIRMPDTLPQLDSPL